MMMFGQPADDDEEERFLADLNKAMLQSLGKTFSIFIHLNSLL